MRTSTRLLFLLGIPLALFALLVGWGVTASRLQAAENPAPVQGALAQATLTPPVDHAAHHEGTATAAAAGATSTEAATEVTPVNTADHAAHHPEASQAVTNTAALSGTMPMDSGMMGGGMAGMMAQMGGMHGEIAAALATLLEENADTLTPEVAAELGRIQGMAESMGAMMGDMHAMAGMAGMMGGDMMQGGMMGGDMMGGMPMTGTMPMTDDMQGMQGMENMQGDMSGMTGMMGMMQAMHADMGAMMENMPADMTTDMADRMADMQAQMDSMMSMLQGMGAMEGTTSMTDTMPMTSTMQGMEGMDHGNMADASQPFDAQFIDSMIQHHQGAIDMAQQALEEAEREELRTMAEDIITAQEAEIAQMQEWRDAWYPDMPETQGMGMAMGDMMLSDDASIPFDRRFIEAMISHHRGAIAMAQAVLTQAEREELRTLAEDIISAQESEISQMQAWNEEWYPDLPPLPAAGDMNMGAAGMGNMAGMHEHMATMMGDMQAMMDEMMADESMMTPGMAADMGRMMGRMEGMSRMMGMMNMMQGGMMDDSMMQQGEPTEDSAD